jgi:tRNA modification GTPase
MTDTIVAVATPPGEGGIGIVRLSGPEAVAITEMIFRPARSGPLRSHRVRYGHIVHPTTGDVVDEVLVTLMRAPHSFTREDVVEISCHGGPLPLQRTIQLALDHDARLANPGEFTLRAFLNGRIDLSQAEATLDIIRAQTTTSLALAQSQLQGWLSNEVKQVRQQLLEALAYITVVVDFPDDEVEPQDITPLLRSSLETVEHLVDTADQGLIYRQGARAVLVGRPNVGKSSLLNVLLRTNRAIVSSIPGTTRDTLEEMANLDGVPVILIDTAGINERSSDPLERLGVERSRAALSMADIAIFVTDRHEPFTPDDIQIAELTMDKPTILVRNKADLSSSNKKPPPFPLDHPHMAGDVTTSLVTYRGIETLVKQMREVLVGKSRVVAGGAHLVTNPRHRDALRRALESLRGAMEGMSDGEQQVPLDILTGDLHAALHALGEITGETVTEDLLDTIFSRFCIGK